MLNEKVFFAFFIVLALTLNFGFFYGDINEPSHHDPYELAAALAVSLIATILKFGDRSRMGPMLLATSLVADLQLIAAAVLWGVASATGGEAGYREVVPSVVSLSGGALLANLVSVTLLVSESITDRN